MDTSAQNDSLGRMKDQPNPHLDVQVRVNVRVQKHVAVVALVAQFAVKGKLSCVFVHVELKSTSCLQQLSAERANVILFFL